ncbi:MAG: DNA-binding protein [Rhodospirillales bacterium]|nr:DNA-binding protein [Rhodospirillales bacterium]
MTAKTLFLAWQDQDRTRRWFPIGRLDADPTRPLYRFRYIRGAEDARCQAGFRLLDDFPQLKADYLSGELFPLFKNRVMTPGRPDFQDYIRHMDLTGVADPIEILEVGGGTRATDAFEVFPKLEKQADGAIRCRFFLHGWRHLNNEAQTRLERLAPGEKLNLALELTNPATGHALQIQTTDYVMIGWAPRYLVRDLTSAILDGEGNFTAQTVRLNPVPAPSRQRLLVELSGRLTGEEPMTTADFEPLAA